MGNPIGVTITGLGSCLPERVLTNRDLEQMVDTSDEWIISHTGIKTRRVSTPEESLPVMMSVAALRALDDAGLSVDEIDYVIAGTNCSDPMLIPQVASRIQYLTGAINEKFIPAFDVVAACSGVSYATEIATRFIRDRWATEEKKTNILVLGGDTLWNVVESDDRSLCILSDAAGAMVLQPEYDLSMGIRHVVNHADGSGGNKLHYWSGFDCQTDGENRHKLGHKKTSPGYFAMEGSEIHKFVMEVGPGLVRELLDGSYGNYSNERLANVKIVPHQTNLVSLNRLRKKIKREFGCEPQDFYTKGITSYANNSTASTIIGLDEWQREEKLDFGDPVMVLAFGGGLTWGGYLTHWTKERSEEMGYDLDEQREMIKELNLKYGVWREGLALPDKERRRQVSK